LTSTDSIASPGHRTLSSRSTRVRITWIRLHHTPLTLTHISLLTVRINNTLWSTTSDGVRLGDQSWLAGTDGIACWINITPCSWSTRIRLTRIWFGSTSEVSAHKPHPAVRIHLTLRLAASDGVWSRGEPGDTPALRVTISVDTAQCTWTTGSGHTWVSWRRRWSSHTQVTRSPS